MRPRLDPLHDIVIARTYNRTRAPDLTDINSALSVLKAVLLIDGQGIDVRKQPALCLGDMQGERSRLAAGRQKLLDIVHMRPRLVFRWKLLQRDKRRCQCFRYHPFVVARNSLFRHLDDLQIFQSVIRNVVGASPLTKRFYAAIRHPGFRAQFITFVLAMMADNIEHVISYWMLYQKFHSPALAGFAIVSHRTHPGRVLLITR